MLPKHEEAFRSRDRRVELAKKRGQPRTTKTVLSSSGVPVGSGAATGDHMGMGPNEDIKYPSYNNLLITSNISKIHLILQENINNNKIKFDDFKKTLDNLDTYINEPYEYNGKIYTLMDTFVYGDNKYEKEESQLYSIFLNFVEYARLSLTNESEIKFITDQINKYTNHINNKTV
tara:strand:- start:135 stop:659 length:525 start_codon:yes stop_codon:yes gene_type:complete